MINVHGFNLIEIPENKNFKLTTTRAAWFSDLDARGVAVLVHR